MPHQMRYTTRLFSFICIQTFIIFIALILIVNWNFSRQNQQYILNYNESAVHGLTERTADQQHYFFQQVNDTYENYYSDKEGLFSKFNSLYPESFSYRQTIYSFLSEMFGLNPELSAVTLYASGDDRIYSMTKKHKQDYPGTEEAFSPLVGAYRDALAILRTEPSSACGILGISRSYSLIYCLYDVITRKNIGALQADYSAEKMESFLYQNYPEVKGDFLIVDLEGTVLFDTSGQWYDRDFPLTEEFLTASFSQREMKVHGTPCHVTIETLSYPKLKIIGLVSNKVLFQDTRRDIILMTLATCAIILLNSVLIYFYLTRSTRQLNHIHQTMLQVREGNLEAQIPVDLRQKNELTDISVAFNDMLHSLNYYIDRVYKSEIENQRYRLRILQSQINPHFLYNTLEAIRMKAVLENQPDIGEMVYILSRIFKNSIKAEGIHTVRQEIENCRNYMNLCNIQYRDLFKYDFSIQESLLPERIIHHALLVMVENYIMHGFDSNRSDNIIRIYGVRENGHAVFHIRDNGFGIHSDELTELLESIQENALDNMEKIGIKNIYQRMKLLYGEDCSLQIHSQYGVGTEIVLSFILRKEGP